MLDRIHFKTEIKASKEQVWRVLWTDSTYREWTSAFTEGSYAVSDWKEGSKVHFLAPSGEGMYSTIEKMIPGELMEFVHHGEMKEGKEVPVSGKANEWSGSKEIYILSENDGLTSLEVQIDVLSEYADHFKSMFPKALENIKRISENTQVQGW